MNLEQIVALHNVQTPEQFAYQLTADSEWFTNPALYSVLVTATVDQFFDSVPDPSDRTAQYLITLLARHYNMLEKIDLHVVSKFLLLAQKLDCVATFDTDQLVELDRVGVLPLDLWVDVASYNRKFVEQTDYKTRISQCDNNQLFVLCTKNGSRLPNVVRDYVVNHFGSQKNWLYKNPAAMGLFHGVDSTSVADHLLKYTPLRYLSDLVAWCSDSDEVYRKLRSLCAVEGSFAKTSLAKASLIALCHFDTLTLFQRRKLLEHVALMGRSSRKPDDELLAVLHTTSVVHASQFHEKFLLEYGLTGRLSSNMFDDVFYSLVETKPSLAVRVISKSVNCAPVEWVCAVIRKAKMSDLVPLLRQMDFQVAFVCEGNIDVFVKALHDREDKKDMLTFFNYPYGLLPVRYKPDVKQMTWWFSVFAVGDLLQERPSNPVVSLWFEQVFLPTIARLTVKDSRQAGLFVQLAPSFSGSLSQLLNVVSQVIIL